jgi:uncharacterized membrane protein SpoIIM required for sporulation
MKETSFIEQNKLKWKKFQLLNATESSDPEEIADLYSDITNDLSYAQTFYNKRTVRVYLNQVAQGIHNQVHKQRNGSLKKFFSFWSISLPLEIYRSRKNLYFSLGMILLWVFVGAISTHTNPDFLRLIVGDDYVRMTDANILKGDPLNVYESRDQLLMFMQIAKNNIAVAFFMFIGGIFFTIGTHILVFNNGIMLGAFQTYFAKKGVLMTSFLGIWLHGALEISAFVIAAGAGFTIGNSILFPKSYTRLQSFQFGAKQGTKIMLALIPILAIAAFIESYITHNDNEISDTTKIIVILLSFGFILFYFFIYPIIVAMKYPGLVNEENLKPRSFSNVHKMGVIREFDQLFSDVFSFYRVYILRIFSSLVVYVAPLIGAIAIIQNTRHWELLRTEHAYDWSQQLAILMGFEVKSVLDIFVGIFWILIFSLILLITLYHFKYQSAERNWQKQFRFILHKILGTFVSMILIVLILLYVPWPIMFLVVFLLPFIWLNGAGVALGDNGFFKNYAISFNYSAKSYATILLTMIVFGGVLLLFSQPIALVFSYHTSSYDFDSNTWVSGKPSIPDLLDLFCDFLKRVTRGSLSWYMELSNMVRQVVYILFLFFILPIFAIPMGFLYENASERYTSNGLRKQFENFGKRKRYQESNYDQL